MISPHDHFIREFSVNADTKTLWMRTAHPQAAGPYVAEATFEGVEGYVLVGDALGTIIFDIEEVDGLLMYDEFGETMRETYRQSGGHAPWVRTRDAAELFFQNTGTKGYALSSSIGLTGAIWARSFTAHWLGPPGDTP